MSKPTKQKQQQQPQKQTNMNSFSLIRFGWFYYQLQSTREDCEHPNLHMCVYV